MFTILKLIIWIAVTVVILAFLRTIQLQFGDNTALFRKGVVPETLPDGLYKGNILGYKVSWLGKKFDAENQKGINIFDEGGGMQSEKFPFKTYLGTGVREKETKVIKIDYDIKENPFWLRLILDEIVEVAPNEYLGKLQLRLIHNFPFTLAYFKLTK